MVLDALGDALRNTLRKIAGASHISPELIKELVKDIQRALIQSDVNVRLALELSKTIENRALEEKAPAGMTGREHVVRIVHQELVKAIGESRSLKLGPQKIMLVGLYGQGKTTTTGKLGKHFKKKGLNLGLIAADVHRPAAFDQLSQIGEQIQIPVFGSSDNKDAGKVVKEGLKEYGKQLAWSFAETASVGLTKHADWIGEKPHAETLGGKIGQTIGTVGGFLVPMGIFSKAAGGATRAFSEYSGKKAAERLREPTKTIIGKGIKNVNPVNCLLYTSDAADE